MLEIDQPNANFKASHLVQELNDKNESDFDSGSDEEPRNIGTQSTIIDLEEGHAGFEAWLK